MITPEDFIETARSYLGIKFQHQGRTRFGIDCAGIIVESCKTLGSILIDANNYAPTAYSEALTEYVSKNCTKIDDERVGSIVTMKWERCRHAHHLAIITNRGLLHTFNNRKKVVEHCLDDKWRSRIVSYWWLNCYEH